MTDSPPQTKRKSALQSTRAERWLLAAAVVLLFGLLFALLLGMNMRRGLNHDEHQFVASAALLSRSALLPYTDFAYFHVPLLSLLYAAIYQFDARLLLGARLVSVGFAWLTLGLVFFSAYRRHGAARLRLRLLFATLATGWMAALPLFIHTSGRAWNHDLPLLLLLLAFFIHSDTLVERHSPLWLGAGGLMMGLATASRLSFALLIVPFLLVLWLYPVLTGRDRWLGLGIFLLGVLVGALPAVLLFANDPAAFLFGNLEYVRLNTEYYREMGQTTAMTLFGKVDYFVRLLLTNPASLIALLVLVVGSWPLRGALRKRLPLAQTARQMRAKDESLFRYGFVLLLLLFAFVSALAATPSQPQYFYLLFPLIVLGSIYAFTAWPAHIQQNGMLFFSGAALATILLAVPAYLPGLSILFEPQEWYPNKVHARGEMVSGLTHYGPVLTLSPIHPLEGDAAIYPEFATGPFGWRVAPLLDVEDRRRFQLVAAEELDDFLVDEPPRGILVGLENDDLAEEIPLVDYAERHGYVPVSLPDEGTLWLAPLASWRESIYLGGYSVPEQPIAPGERPVLTLYLENRKSLDKNLNVLVRLLDADGAELLRDEGWPWGSPTSGWQEGDVWADGHELQLPEAMQPGYYAIEVDFYDPADLDDARQPTVIGHLLVGDLPEEGTSTPPLGQFANGIELLDIEVDAASPMPGGSVPIRLTWRTIQPLAVDQTIFLHVVDADGTLVAQVDRPPMDGFLPTSHWIPMAPVIDDMLLTLPIDLPTGSYAIHLGLYDGNTLQRTPILSGTKIGDDVLVVESIEIQ